MLSNSAQGHQLKVQPWAASELAEQTWWGYNSVYLQLDNFINFHCKLLQPHPDAAESPQS